MQFEQTSEDAPTKITYNLSGMDPSSKRGFHVQYNHPSNDEFLTLVPSVITPTDVSLLVHIPIPVPPEFIPHIPVN